MLGDCSSWAKSSMQVFFAKGLLVHIATLAIVNALVQMVRPSAVQAPCRLSVERRAGMRSCERMHGSFSTGVGTGGGKVLSEHEGMPEAW